MKTGIIFIFIIFIAFSAEATPNYSVIDIGTLGGDYSAGQAINNYGVVTGESNQNNNPAFVPFLYKNAITNLGSYGYAHTYVIAINPI